MLFVNPENSWEPLFVSAAGKVGVCETAGLQAGVRNGKQSSTNEGKERNMAEWKRQEG